jgi:hypothetical protein
MANGSRPTSGKKQVYRAQRQPARLASPIHMRAPSCLSHTPCGTTISDVVISGSAGSLPSIWTVITGSLASR